MNYESQGNEILYDGKSGKQIETSIFIGPCYYQRLKHMVADKQHSRCIGPMVNLTRQPAEGRSRDGGLRFGEMERDRLMENTLISLDIERSIRIKNICGNKISLLSYDENEDTVNADTQTNFMSKGVRPCMEVRFQDGRIVDVLQTIISSILVVVCGLKSINLSKAKPTCMQASSILNLI